MVPTLRTKSAANHSPSRVIIDRICPNLGEGRFPARCCLGAPQIIEATILCDGHDKIKADLLIRHERDTEWTRNPMGHLGNNAYRVLFWPEKNGLYIFNVEASIDRIASWKESFLKKFEAGAVVQNDIEDGLSLMQIDHKYPMTQNDVFTLLQDAGLIAKLRQDWSDESVTRYGINLPLYVDPSHAGFSAWYEFFPRSRWSGVAEKGNLQDAAARLVYIADMGFDIVYLPPIHPIGKVNRKGANNSLQPSANDPGSPWAIGNKDGGHKSIDPALGDFYDFKKFLHVAEDLNLKVALDLAFQCAPDHPYVREHPEWFRAYADGTIRYAENPPKKYQDIYPFDFECAEWEALWSELKSVIEFWIEKGVTIFRVDNPHTKSFPFWEWVIGEIRKNCPEAIFLAEAFTTPDVMAYLAKIGFSQSYTYFAWRQSKAEITTYMKELTESELRHFFRPNFWPNTPDILTKQLQNPRRPPYVQRLILAATLSPNYGIYGPAFELMDCYAIAAGSEEYKDSEKYQIKTWDIEHSDSLAPLIRRVNHIRRDNPALQSSRGFMFHPVDNEQIIAYTRQDGGNLILVVVNLDPNHIQSGIIDLQIQILGLDTEQNYHLHDLLSDAHYDWKGWKNYVELNPHVISAHIFQITQSENV